MATKHTPEPWFTESMAEYYAGLVRKGRDWAKGMGESRHERARCAGIWASDRKDEIVTTDSGVYGPSIEDARRIVACVNACAGMTDPAAEIAELRAQRDELLLACKSLQTAGNLRVTLRAVLTRAITRAEKVKP